MRTLEHPTLGEVEVLLEVMYKEKHFYLIRKVTEHHYCMWGNTNDPAKMGTTKLTTLSGKKPSSNRINKMFLEMVNESDNLIFKK